MLWQLGQPRDLTRRRRRSPGGALRVAGAGAVAVLLLAGCGTPSSTTPPDGGNGSSAPTPTLTTPSPTPTAPARSVSASNLLTAEVIPLDPTYQTPVETPDGVGRPVGQSYVCLPDDGLASLGATSMVTRNFGYRVDAKDMDPYPKSPLKDQPVVYSQALQFPDEATATAARARYVGWIKACPTTLTEKGYSVDTDQSLKPTAVAVEGGKAQAGMVAYVRPGDSDAVHLYWESAGVTQVKDRLMLTVLLSWGEDTPGTFDTSDGDFIHPQVALVEESVLRLAG
jgi:hypothetical protein